jgi:hypothetical protein
MNKTYLVTIYWRGALNIGDMRVFDNPVEAFNYYSTLQPPFRKFYEVSKGESPKLYKDKDTYKLLEDFRS